MKTLITGFGSAILGLIGYYIYEWIHKNWFKRKDFFKTAEDVKFSEEVSSFLWKKAKSKLKQLVAYDKKGEEILAAGFEIVRINDQLLAEIQAGLSRDYISYISYFDTKTKNLAIIKGNDKFSILKTMQTHSEKYNVSNGKLINELRSLDKKVPFTITGAGFDWVELFFETLPSDIEAILTKATELCPLQEISQKSLTSSELSTELLPYEEELKTTRKLFLWWPMDKEENVNTEDNKEK